MQPTVPLDAKNNDDIPPCLSVVMAVYNEEATVTRVLETVLQQRPVEEIIVVDDASSDQTWPVLQEFVKEDTRVQLLQHKENQGKGAALRTGFKHTSAQIVIIQDADLEYDPGEYYLVLNPILSGRGDVVYGSRCDR